MKKIISALMTLTVIIVGCSFFSFAVATKVNAAHVKVAQSLNAGISQSDYEETVEELLEEALTVETNSEFRGFLVASAFCSILSFVLIIVIIVLIILIASTNKKLKKYKQLKFPGGDGLNGVNPTDKTQEPYNSGKRGGGAV